MPHTYYPSTNEGRAAWWDNVIAEYSILTSVGFTTTEGEAVARDAKFAVYFYRTVRETFEEMMSKAVHYSNVYTGEPSGTPAPTTPTVPTFPEPPDNGAFSPGIEERRQQWVAKAKASPNYNTDVGVTLKIEPTGTPFDPATYQAVLFAVTSSSSKTVSAKFRKAGGDIDGINLYGRKVGATTWTQLGRFTAAPLTALVPLAAADNETWEFRARAVKRDVEIGVPSDIVEQIIRA